MEKTLKFIEKAKGIHNEKYTYKKSKYVNAKTKLIITCPIHDDFEQTPDNHIYTKKGCSMCAGVKKYSNKEIIEKFKLVHKKLYNYSAVRYDGMFKKVKVICEIHGVFTQTPKNHLLGKGCGKCKGKHQTTKDIIQKFKKIHEELYDYSKVDYKKMKTKVIIICKKHGKFSQTPETHIRGSGCPNCKHSKGESIIYKLLKDNEIFFDQQKTFDKCFNPITTKKLPFDFFIPKLNICIEYDGEQHFKKMRFKNSNLKEIQYRDELKNRFCKNNNIKLLRISYKNFNNIKTIINEKILLIF